MKATIIKVGLLTSILGASSYVSYDLTVAGEFEVYPSHNADVRAAVDGIIEDVLVVEGETVRKGQVVARLSAREHRSELREIEAELREQQANVRRLRSGARAEEIAVAEEELDSTITRVQHAVARHEEARKLKTERLSRATKAIENAREQLRFAELGQARVLSLKKKGIVSEKRLEQTDQQVAARRAELEAAQAEINIVEADDLAEPSEDLAAARAAMEEARVRLKLIRAGSRPEDIEAAEAAISRLEAKRDYINEHLGLVVVRSPITGVVTTPKPQEKKSSFVEKGDLILEVYDLRSVKAEILVAEKEIGDVAIGQPVFLKARSHPDKDFHGVVEQIAPIAAGSEAGPKRRTVRVITSIENPDSLLKPGMTGHGKITCCERTVFNLLTRRLVHYVRVEFWSWW